MPNPVVVTRPLAQAGQLAKQIAGIGRQATVFPLLEIHALPDMRQVSCAFENLERYGMVAFVSPNAVHFALAEVQSWPLEVAIGVVGDGSRAALAEHGITAPPHIIFSPSDPNRSDSEGLLASLDMERLRGKPVLIVRGENGRELLGDELRAHGIAVTHVAAYRRSAPVMSAETRSRLDVLLHADHDWLITSSEALRNLVRMTSETAGEKGVQKLQHQAFYVSHARIAEAARELGFKKLILTGPGDAGLLAALQCRP